MNNRTLLALMLITTTSGAASCAATSDPSDVVGQEPVGTGGGDDSIEGGPGGGDSSSSSSSGASLQQTICDDGIALDENDASVALRALELCETSGVVSAKWVLPDGSELDSAISAVPGEPLGQSVFEMGHGVATEFGAITPRTGSSMLVLSTGAARTPNDPGYQEGAFKGFSSGHPDGFPITSPSCPGVIGGTPYDGVALEVVLQAPAEANALAYDLYFLTYEWPNFVCSVFNDFFLTLMDPRPAGLPTDNVAFDVLGNPISVNNALLAVCGCDLGPPCMAGNKPFLCAQGTDDLAGTGFEAGASIDEEINPGPHGGSGWLETRAPVRPGEEVRIRFAIYDAGDGALDSTVLIDNFRWLADDAVTGTMPIPK